MPPSRGKPSGKPGASPTPFFTPGASPLRHAVERRSAVVLVFLRGLPRPVPGLVMLGVLALGILAHGLPGTLGLLVVAALLGWFSYLGWPAVRPVGRAVRLAVIALTLGYAVVKLAR